jgi:hypothetical protein
MTTTSWIRCNLILADLSSNERRGLKALANGQVCSFTSPVMEKLKSQQLVKFERGTWVLTDDGQVVAFWSDRLHGQQEKRC